MALPLPVALLGLGLAFSLPAIGWYARWRRPDQRDLDWPAVRLGLLRSLAVLAALLALVLAAGGPDDLGLGVPSVGTLVDGVLFGLVAFAGAMLAVGLVGRFAGGVAADPASLVLFEQPVHRRLGAALVTAGVESVVLYGFVVEALLGLGAGPVVAGGAAALGTVLVHGRWGARHAAQWAPGSIVLAGIAVATRSAVVVFVVLFAYALLSLLSSDADDFREPVDAG